ncbi:MAG: PQQ-binding-like beta-propeller repeat protein, partial [Candidatus Zixiibacteriota bacterium]
MYNPAEVRYAIWDHWAKQIIIDSCIIKNNYNGIAVHTGSNIVVKFCDIIDNQGCGIFYTSTTGKTNITYNNIYNNALYESIDIDYASSINNDFRYNYWGPTATAEMNAGGNPKNISTINDYYDDPNRGEVDYSHWLDAPYPEGQPVGETYDADLRITNHDFTEDMLTYHTGDSIFIQITDLDRNTDGIIPDQLTLDIWSETETTHETLTLNETDLATGIFRGWIKLDDATGVPFPDGQLQLSHGDWMYFRYIDPANDWGYVDTMETGIVFNLTVYHGQYFYGNKILTKEDSPYLFTGDIAISSGILIIEPGVKVYLRSTSDLNIWENSIGSSKVDILHGRFRFFGTEENPIIFSTYDKFIDDKYWGSIWSGIGENGDSLDYCIVEYATDGYRASHGTAPTITNSIFRYNKDCGINNRQNCGEKITKIINNTCYNNNCGINTSKYNQIVKYNTLENNTVDFNINNDFQCSPGYENDISFNNFKSSSTINFINQSNVDANYVKFNYWGPTATAEMNTGDNPKNISTITDYFDDPSRGMVNYSRWLDAPWPDGTPAPGGFTGEMRFTYADGSDAWGYHEGDTLYVSLYDPDLNTDINTPEYATVEVWSELESVPEMLMLNEVDADTGLFTGWMLLDGQTGFAMTDGVLQVDQCNRVWAQYTDALDDWNNQNTTVLDSVTYDFRIREYEPDENTVLLLHLNEGTGQYVSDESSNNWSGYIGTSDQIEEDDPSWTSNGISNSGIQFDVGDRFYYYINSGFMENDELTAECWINIHDDTGQRQNIITANGSFALYRDGNNKISLHLYLSEGSIGGFIYSDKPVFEYRKWHHCAIVKTSDSLKIYVDKHFVVGAEHSGQLPNYSSASMLELRFGAIPEGNYSFKGVKDEIRLSNIARTSFDYEYTENPPGKINDLAITDSTSRSITLQWHAPGADNYTGTCELYDLRMSTSPIDSANFTSASPVSPDGSGQAPLPSPASAGTLQSFTIDSLNYATTWYFAIKAKDDEGLWSPISNIAVGHTEPKDETPPGTISNLALSSASKRSAIISWTAPADDGQSGRAISGYRVYYATFPINSTNFNSADSLPDGPAGITPGSAISDTLTGLLPNTTYYAAVRSYDEVPNWSALSNILQLSTEAVPVIANTTFPINAFDAQRSRSVPYNGATLGTFRWTFGTGAAVSSSPVIDNDGTVYVGSEDGKVYAVDPGGNELWNKNLGAGVFAAPCIGTENHLFVSCKNNKVYALNKANGDTIWTYTTGGQVYGSPVISSFGYLYVGALDNKVYALTSDAGDLVWTFTGSGKFYASPALTIDESKLIIGDQAGKLYALNPNSGAKLWEYPVNSAIYANAAIDSVGNVYCGAQNGNLYCLSFTGAYKWDYNTGGAIFYASPTVGYTAVTKSGISKSTDVAPVSLSKMQDTRIKMQDGDIKSQNSINDQYQVPKTKDVSSLNIRKNSQYQVSNIEPQFQISNFQFPFSTSKSVSAAEVIYIGSDGDKLHAVNAGTGAMVWTYTTQGDIRNGAVLSANGYLYFGSADDSLYCIKNDGTRRWAYKTGGDLYTSNPAMGLDGAVYIGSYDNKLYAVGEYLEVVDPVVVATYPTVNSCTAPADTVIQVKFNTLINMFTVTENTFHVTGKQHGRYTGTYSWNAADSAGVFTSDDDFFCGEEITVLL